MYVYFYFSVINYWKQVFQNHLIDVVCELIMQHKKEDIIMHLDMNWILMSMSNTNDVVKYLFLVLPNTGY